MDPKVMERILTEEEWTGTINRIGGVATIRNQRRELVADVYGETPEKVQQNVRYAAPCAAHGAAYLRALVDADGLTEQFEVIGQARALLADLGLAEAA